MRSLQYALILALQVVVLCVVFTVGSNVVGNELHRARTSGVCDLGQLAHPC